MHQDDRMVHPPQHPAKEPGVRLDVDVSVGVRLVVQVHVPSAGRERQHGRDRHLVPVAGAVDERCRVPARGERATDEREQQEPALVREGEACPAVDGFFLMTGHAWATHAAITLSSRSRATRGGTWGLIPRTRSHALRYRWFIRTP